MKKIFIKDSIFIYLDNRKTYIAKKDKKVLTTSQVTALKKHLKLVGQYFEDLVDEELTLSFKFTYFTKWVPIENFKVFINIIRSCIGTPRMLTEEEVAVAKLSNFTFIEKYTLKDIAALYTEDGTLLIDNLSVSMQNELVRKLKNTSHVQIANVPQQIAGFHLRSSANAVSIGCKTFDNAFLDIIESAGAKEIFDIQEEMAE